MLLQMPFNCETFSELLKAVKQATDEKDFEPYYVAVVARFFSDFADITERDGYVVEDHVSSRPLLYSPCTCIR